MHNSKSIEIKSFANSYNSSLKKESPLRAPPSNDQVRTPQYKPLC